MKMRSRSGAVIKVNDESLREAYIAQGFVEVKPKAKPRAKRAPKKNQQ